MPIKYVYDPQILSYIDSLSIKILYLKATLLNNNDIPIQSLEGQLTSGNITLNGTSSVRRQGSVSFIIDPLKKLDEQYLKNLFFLNKRISLEIGFDNTGNQYIEEYNQFWFKLGTFIITQPSISKNTNNGISISLTLNDKMSLLNGTAGGLIPTSVVDSPMYTIDDKGELKSEYPLIYDMIKTFVHEAGGIPLNQIIIGDVERQIRNQVWWASHDTPIYYNDNDNDKKFSTIGSGKEYTYGQNIGYKWVALTYPTDKEFVSNAGEAITSLLDKVKNVLGNYEYFFDIDGNFRFQMIKNYLNQGSEIDDLTDALTDKYFNNLSDVKSVYTFENDNRHTTISNNPVYKDIKNDIIIYGKHGKTEQIIRYHLLIMNKPSIGNTYYVDNYTDDEGFIRARGVYLSQETDNEKKPKYTKVVTWDWRQELYLLNKLNKVKNFLAYEIDMEVPKMLNILNSAEDKDANDQPISHSLYYKGLEHQLSYYIDILDPYDFSGDLYEQLQAISINNIGLKSTTITDDTVNCVFTVKAPDVDIDKNNVMPDNLQKYVQVGVTANPAFEVARSALHTYLGYNSSISIQTIPIYHLEPNSRITVIDDDTGISGDYIINSLTIQLSVNGMMSISATRALERI